VWCGVVWCGVVWRVCACVGMCVCVFVVCVSVCAHVCMCCMCVVCVGVCVRVCLRKILYGDPILQACGEALTLALYLLFREVGTAK